MQIEHLRTFVDLAETLNFRQTSENMNLTQPAVTQIIKSLEVQLSVELFIRTKQRVRLTQAGVIFYNDTKLLLKKFYSSVERVKEVAQQANQTLTIGFSGTAFEMNILPKIISKFKKKHPTIHIHLENFNHNILKKDLISKSCDIIFQTLDSVETLSNVQFTPLMSGEFVCVLPEKHSLSTQAMISFDDLANQNIILFNSYQCPPKQADVQRLIKEKCPDGIFCYADSILLSHTMIQSGLGISVMPNFITNFSNYQHYTDLSIIPFDYKADLVYGIASLKNNDKTMIHSFISSTCAFIENEALN